MTSKIKSLTDQEFSEIVSKSDSIKDVQAALGYRSNSGIIFYQIRDRIENLSLDTKHFGRKWIGVIGEKSKKHDLCAILIENSSYKNISRLKKRIVAAGLLIYECECCKNPGTWMGKELSLQLDHKNGIPTDHRIENLRMLCPNCHSQTHNFSGRNR